MCGVDPNGLNRTWSHLVTTHEKYLDKKKKEKKFNQIFHHLFLYVLPNIFHFG